MKDFNPASPKTNSAKKRANSIPYNVSRTTITIVNHAYVVTIVMTKWYILGFTLKRLNDDCLTRPEERRVVPLLEQINNSVVAYVNSSQIPSTPSKSIQSLAKYIKKSLCTQLNYSTVYNDILVAITQYNIWVDKLNHLTDKMKNSMLTTTRTNRSIRKCRGPVKNNKVKINSFKSGARDISDAPNNVLSVLCESFPYLQKVINI